MFHNFPSPPLFFFIYCLYIFFFFLGWTTSTFLLPTKYCAKVVLNVKMHSCFVFFKSIIMFCSIKSLLKYICAWGGDHKSVGIKSGYSRGYLTVISVQFTRLENFCHGPISISGFHTSFRFLKKIKKKLHRT